MTNTRSQIDRFASAILLVAALLASVATAAGDDAATNATVPAKEKVKVFIFAGQSNMVGRSDPKLLPEEYRKLPPNVRLYAKQQWRELGGPLRDQQDGVGPEVSAAGLIAKEFPNEKIILVKTAIGGTNLHTQWSPTREGSLYHQMIKDVKTATEGLDAEIVAIFWAQGGADSKDEAAAKAYGKNLTAFIEAARRDLRRADLPFIFSMRAEDLTDPRPPAGGKTFRVEVTQGKAEVAKTVPHTATVSTSGLTLKSDNIHYDTAGTIEFGRRFFEAWQKNFHTTSTAGASTATSRANNKRPNVILIMTDDQGYGDTGAHGNTKIMTPNLDRFAGESVEIDPFYVSPVCSPTRASLMTGRWNYRTGVTDTFGGRAMMRSSETTIAEVLRDAGYRTGIFGKWHLGDCYPYRPIDQGFEEAIVHRGGVLGVGDDPPGTTYFDPILQRNGKPERTKGYCTDVFTDAAIRFITSHKDEPFFAYIPYNAPHSPFQIADEYVAPYEKMQLKASDFPPAADPVQITDHTTQVYAMVTNIDDNLGRLFKTVDDLGLRDNTIVIFMTDNGPNGVRYRAGLQSYKGNVHEGGIRTMFFLRWPAALQAGHNVAQPCAHIDVLPTIAEACGVTLPDDLKLDGRSFLPLLKQEKTDWPDRNLYLQWHRGTKPTPYLGFAVRGPRYKLLFAGNPQKGGTYTTPTGVPKEIPFELYDLQTDPYETKNIAADHPDIVAAMRVDYDRWLADVTGDQAFTPMPIIVGTPHESPTVLTPQDFAGGWKIGVEQPGRFEFVGFVGPAKEARTVHLDVQGKHYEQRLEANAARWRFADVDLASSPAFNVRMSIDHGDGQRREIRYVELARMSVDPVAPK